MGKTRERLIAIDQNQSSVLFARHVAAYKFCAQYCLGKRVIDIGCGDGYGTNLLSKYASEVVGIDMDKATIVHAHEQYTKKNITFAVGDAESLPGCITFDVVVSFQLIEHIHDTEKYLSQIKKVLKKNGIVVLTTPNRLLRLENNQKPWNTFHITEYSGRSLYSLLSRYFDTVEIRGLTAIKSVYDVERRRLFIRRLISRIDPFNLYQYIPKEASDFVLEMLRIFRGKEKRHAFNVSSSDFYVSKNNVDRSLDLVAICMKR